ncbi:MAG: hypothetical protein OXN23_03630, partial [Gammaproteobacteria bacterium]|nr:hypothetical protein [Gammaproteobacteria bacterium]
IVKGASHLQGGGEPYIYQRVRLPALVDDGHWHVEPMPQLGNAALNLSFHDFTDCASNLPVHGLRVNGLLYGIDYRLFALADGFAEEGAFQHRRVVASAKLIPGRDCRGWSSVIIFDIRKEPTATLFDLLFVYWTTRRTY